MDSTNSHSRIWDTMTGQCLRTLVHEDNPPVTSVCFSPNGRYVLAFSLDSCVRLWDYIEGKGSVRRTYQGHRNERFSIGGCFGFTVAPSTSSAALPGVPMTRAYIAGPSEDGSVVLWDVRTKEILQRIEGLFPAGNASANSGKSSGAGADGAGGSVCFWVDVHGSTMVAAGQDGSIVLLRDRNATKGRKKKGKDGDKEADGEETTAVGSRAGRLDDLAAGLDGINLAAHMDDPTVAAVFA